MTRILRWVCLAVVLMAVIITGAVVAEVIVEILRAYGIGNGSCGNNPTGYVVGAVIGYMVAKNGWL